MTEERGAPIIFNGRYTDDPASIETGQEVVCRYDPRSDNLISWQVAENYVNGKFEAEATITEDHIICTQLSSATTPTGPEWHLYYARVTPKPADVDEQQYKVERNTYLGRLVLVSPPSALVDKYSLKPGCPLLSTSTIWPVVTTLSGGEHAEAIFSNLVGPFLICIAVQSRHWPKDTIRTTSASSITEFAEGPLLAGAQRGEKQLVVLLSGDGGIVDIVNAIAGKDAKTPPTIALVPCGTGNALANSTSAIPLASPTLGLRTLALGSACPLPLLQATFDPPATVYVPDAESPLDSTATVQRVHAAVVISWGLHAALVADSDTPAYRKHGAARFGLAARENLYPSDGSLPHAYKGKLSLAPHTNESSTSIDTKTHTKEPSPLPSNLEPVDRSEHAYVLATLVACLEKGFCISPDSRPLDGRLRVVHFGPQPKGGDGVMALMKAAYDGGKHVDDEALGYVTADSMSLELQEKTPRWRRVCVDGKIFVAAHNGRIDINVADDKPVVELVHVA